MLKQACDFEKEGKDNSLVKRAIWFDPAYEYGAKRILQIEQNILNGLEIWKPD